MIVIYFKQPSLFNMSVDGDTVIVKNCNYQEDINNKECLMESLISLKATRNINLTPSRISFIYIF